MSKNKIRLLFLCLFLVGIGSCFYTSHRALGKLTAPLSISKDNIPLAYYVVALDGDNKPFLLKSDLSDEEWLSQQASLDFKKIIEKKFVVCPSEYGLEPRLPLSFYIKNENIRDLNVELTKRLNDPTQSVTIKVRDDDPSGLSQVVFIDFWSDDFNYYSIYKVTKEGVVLEKYGDVLKSDGFEAFVAGLKSLFIVFVLGSIVLMVVARCVRK